MAEDVHVSQASASSVGVLALDIGGANLKAADGRGWCHAEPFAMWREQARLAEVLKGILAVRPDCGRVVATMTGEIADCFSSRAEGVQFILAALEEACLGREVLVYLVDGTLVSPAVAGKRFHQVASYQFDVRIGHIYLLTMNSWISEMAVIREPTGAVVKAEPTPIRTQNCSTPSTVDFCQSSGILR